MARRVGARQNQGEKAMKRIGLREGGKNVVLLSPTRGVRCPCLQYSREETFPDYLGSI